MECLCRSIVGGPPAPVSTPRAPRRCSQLDLPGPRPEVTGRLLLDAPSARRRPMAFALPRLARPAGGRAWLSLAVQGLAFFATPVVTAQNEHAPYDISPGQFAVVLAAVMPPVAAVAAAWAVQRPWPAFVAILLLAPCWDAAQVAWQVGPVQVLPQTVFVLALTAGWLLRPTRSDTDEPGIAAEPRGADEDDAGGSPIGRPARR